MDVNGWTHDCSESLFL